MCGCNKKIQKKEPVSKTRKVLRKLWEKTQQVEKPLVVKEINKP
jgi:hypothetical protein